MRLHQKKFTKIGNEIRECGLAPKGTLIRELSNSKPVHVYLSPDATLKDAEKAFEAMG